MAAGPMLAGYGPYFPGADPRESITGSAAWQLVKSWAERRKAGYELALKDTNLLHEETQMLRAKLQELEALLNLPNPSKMPTVEPTLEP